MSCPKCGWNPYAQGQNYKVGGPVLRKVTDFRIVVDHSTKRKLYKGLAESTEKEFAAAIGYEKQEPTTYQPNEPTGGYDGLFVTKVDT